jgi:hypothetical protein
VELRLNILDDLSEVEAKRKNEILIFDNEAGNRKEICYEKNSGIYYFTTKVKN